MAEGMNEGRALSGASPLAAAAPTKSVYISGPMTGYPDFNYPAFHERSAAWREAGWTVLCSAENFDGSQTESYAAYMRKDIEDLLNVSAIAMLNGWEKSKGANLELSIARVLGLTILDAHTFAPLLDGAALGRSPSDPPTPMITDLRLRIHALRSEHDDRRGHGWNDAIDAVDATLQNIAGAAVSPSLPPSPETK